MSKITKITHNVQQPEDINKLCIMAGGIIGEECWQAKFLTNGDELILDFGVKIPLVSDPGKSIGAWFLESWGTDWKLISSDEILTSSDDMAERINEGIQAIVNCTVFEFEIHYPTLALSITFSNNNEFMIIPNPEDDEFTTSYWDLYTPQHNIYVGPGAKWSYEEFPDK